MKWRDSLRDVTNCSAMPAFWEGPWRTFGHATPPHGRRLLPPHGQATLRDTTVRRAGTASPDAVPQLHGWQSHDNSVIAPPQAMILAIITIL